MAVQKDGSVVVASGTATSTTLNGPSITIGSNSNRVLLVHVLIGASAVPTIDSVSFNSVSMTRLNSIQFGNLLVETWRLVAPGTVTAAPVVSITGTADEWTVFAQSVYNVDQSTPEVATARTNSGTAGNALCGCEGIAGGLAVGIAMMGDAVSAIDSADGTPQYVSVGTASQSAGATSINPTGAPAGRTYGGLEFCSVSTANNETISVSGTGWAAVGAAVASGSTWQERLFVRQYNGTNVDPTFSWTSSVACSARRWFAADAQATFGTQTSNTGSTSTHSINGNNATANKSLVMYVDHAKANTALGADAGYTERFDAGSATGPYRLVVGDRAEATSGAGADNFSATGANAAWVMQLLELLAQTSQTHEAEVENLDASVSAAVATEPGDSFNTISFVPTGTVGEWAALAVTLNPVAAGSSITPSAGSLGLSTAAPNILDRKVGALGSFVLTGAAPVVTQQFAIQPPVGALTMTGAAPTVGQINSINPAAAILSLTGNAPSISVSGSVSITPSAGSLALSGKVPTVSTPNTITPQAGTLTLTGAVSLQTLGVTPPAAGALALTGIAPQVIPGQARTPTVGAISLSGQTPSVVQGGMGSPATVALGLSGAAPTLIQGIRIAPPAGALATSSAAPTVQSISSVIPGSASLAFLGAAPQVTQQLNISPPAGALTLTGKTPFQGNVVIPGVGTLTLTGASPSVSGPKFYNIDSGALAFSGYPPRIINTSASTTGVSGPTVGSTSGVSGGGVSASGGVSG